MPKIRPLPNQSSENAPRVAERAAVQVEQAHRQLVVQEQARGPCAIENIASVAMNGTTRP